MKNKLDIIQNAIDAQTTPRKCLEEINNILKAYNCVIDPVFEVVGPVIRTHWQVRYLGPQIGGINPQFGN